MPPYLAMSSVKEFRMPARGSGRGGPSGVLTRAERAVRLAQDADTRVPELSRERARKCIEAAALKSQGWPYRRIAAHFGWSSPAAAHKAVQVGLSLIPSEGVEQVRRSQSLVLDDVVSHCYEVIGDPGPLVSQGKVMWKDEAAGVFFADQMARIRALEVLLKASAEVRKLHGADAAKRTLSLVGSIPEAEIEAEIARLRAQAGTAEGGLVAALEGVEDPVVDAEVTGEGDTGGE